MRRVLSWLLSFCFLCSVLFGVAFGAEWTNIDDMGIDPWGDLEAIQALPTPSQEVYTISDDVSVDDGIMPLSQIDFNPSVTMDVYLSGFAARGSDEDGSEWQGTDVDSKYLYKVSSGQLVTTSGYSPFNTGSGQVSPLWSGRPGIINGDPDITNETRIGFEGGMVRFRVPYPFAQSDYVKAIQFYDMKYAFYLDYGYWTDYSARYGVPPNVINSNCLTRGSFEGAELYINGESVGRILTSSSSTIINGRRLMVIELNNQIINLETPQVTYDIEVVFNFGPASYTDSTMDAPGGYGLIFAATRSNVMVSNDGFVDVQIDGSAENTGLLKSIIEFLQNIVNGITGIASAIAELPGKIVTALIEGIKSLFIPSEEDFTQLKDKYETLLSSRLGFVWQVGDLVVDFGQSLLSALQGGSDYVFHFPGITLELPEVGSVTLVPEQDVSLENAAMDVLRPVLGTIVSLICVIAFINVTEDMLVALISGVSYFNYLKGGKEDGD